MEVEMKKIVGYEEHYAVDKKGNIYSLKQGKIRKLKATCNGNGYMRLNLSKDGKRKKYYVHRLVAEAYLPDFSEDLQVDHIDRDRTNNCISNLRMVTQQQNKFNTNAKGCYFYKNRNKWHARIVLNGKSKHLGYFDNQDDAHRAYLYAKEKYHKIIS
jgi:hypothetical protein